MPAVTPGGGGWFASPALLAGMVAIVVATVVAAAASGDGAVEDEAEDISKTDILWPTAGERRTQAGPSELRQNREDRETLE